MALSLKYGQCLDCETGPDKPLTAGRCQFHYWKYRNQVNESKRRNKEPKADKKAQKQALTLWFVDKINKMPRHCENCGDRLLLFAPWAAKSFIAHIVAKRNFKSVATHPNNCVYLCLICHTNFDNWPEEKVTQMPVISICIARYNTFKDDIEVNEWRYLPNWLESV